MIKRGTFAWPKACLAILAFPTTLGLFAMRVPAEQQLPQAENPSQELQDDLARLDSFLSSRNLDSLEKVADKDSAKWQKRDRQSSVRYLLKVCSIVSSYDWRDESRQSLLLSRYAIAALTSGNLPVEEYVQFAEFLTLDPLRVDEATWKNLRLQKAQLLLEAWRQLTDSVDTNFNFDDRPELNVPAPAGSNVPSGISPEAIKDPKLRSEYEGAIARNSAKARRYNEQYWLKRNAPRFYQAAEKYLITAYSRPPTDLAQLERLLSQYIQEPSTRRRILDHVPGTAVR
ncbi:MAG: hypothetical protein WA789_16155 [Candidatus Acidiferrum sp.]